MAELPTIKVEVKSASTLRDGLKDINGRPLPKTGIIIKKVTHHSPDPMTEYIVPEGSNYHNYLTTKLNSVDMTEFIEKAKQKTTR